MKKDMSKAKVFSVLGTVFLLVTVAGPAFGSGDADRGRKVFRACIACHSLEPGRQMTGPSLATIWGRKAGTVAGFTRYSKAMKQSHTVWDEKTLDAWLKNPRSLIPGNRMIFPGIAKQAHRQDLIAYLRQVSKAGGGGQGGTAGRSGEGMGGGMMMRQNRPINLRELGPNNHITSIGHCGDTYTVATRSGETHQFWEFNVRFKSDGSKAGPQPDQPVLIPSGMRGDRVFVIFSAPSEISAFIKKAC